MNKREKDMGEVIVSIEDATFTTRGSYGWQDSFDGYKIVTNKQEILIGIDNGQSCCEQWGYLSSQDDFSDFIGATLLNINEVDDQYAVESISSQMKEGYISSGVFINVETSKGTLQFVLYNEHNGYYGHSYVIKSNQLNMEGSL